MNDRLVKQVVLAAWKGERGVGGWIKIEAPGASEKDISLAIMEAKGRALVKAVEVTSHDSTYPEWKLTGPTVATRPFLDEAKRSKSFRHRVTWASAGVVVAIIAILVSIFLPEIRNVLGLDRKTDATQQSGPAVTTGSKSPAITGNGNTVT